MRSGMMTKKIKDPVNMLTSRTPMWQPMLVHLSKPM